MKKHKVMWHVTHDRLGDVKILLKFQLFNSKNLKTLFKSEEKNPYFIPFIFYFKNIFFCQKKNAIILVLEIEKILLDKTFQSTPFENPGGGLSVTDKVGRKPSWLILDEITWPQVRPKVKIVHSSKVSRLPGLRSGQL